MLNRLAQLREKRENGDRGFTLIELLVVVVIIGILIAIAIPLYLNYKKGANDKAAESDLRGAVSVMEQCQSDNAVYPANADVPTTGGDLSGTCTGKVSASDHTTFTYFHSAAGDPENFLMTATNSDGSGKEYCYASAAGGSVKSYASVPSAYADSCG
jgi:type IV pilus assembly protein PilA